MIVTFDDKPNKKYEAQDDHVDEIFESIKTQMIAICDKYKNNDRDLIIAVSTMGIMSDIAKNTLRKQYDSDKIIEILQANEI